MFQNFGDTIPYGNDNFTREVVFTIPGNSWEDWKSGKEVLVISCGPREIVKSYEEACKNNGSILTNNEVERDVNLWCTVKHFQINKTNLGKKTLRNMQKIGYVPFSMVLQREEYC